MEPQYFFCTSIDGTRIAYATYGSGPPLLFVNTWVISMYAQFTWPEARVFFDDLAAHTTLVIFDRRGTGASARDVDDISPDAEAEDLRAVADAAGLHTFTLFGDAAGGSAVCARFAAAYPECAQRLVFWAPQTSTFRGEADKETARTFRKDWSYGRRIWAGLIYREGPVSLQRAASKAFRDSVSAEMAARRFETEVDLAAMVPAVTQPVLVMERETGPGQPFAMRVAGLLPNGRLRLVPGASAMEYPNHEAIVEAVVEFLGVGEQAVPKDRGEPVSSTAVILFADIVDSTALSEQLGNVAFRERSRALEEQVKKHVDAHSGRAVDGRTLGDGVLATFASASDAIAAALACATEGKKVGLALHLGLHAGDIIREQGNVYGQAVSIASRVSDLSAPNEVLVSGTVRDLARASASVSFEDRGERELKGVGEPVRLYEVRWRD